MNSDSDSRIPFYLPDFCNARATLAIVLIVELTAIILTLAHQSMLVDFWTDLVRTSMFLLWIGLAGAGLLCLLRGRLARLTVSAGSAAVLGLITAVVTAVSLCVYLIGRTAGARVQRRDAVSARAGQLCGAQRVDRADRVGPGTAVFLRGIRMAAQH
jgi:peptidoglycan/LPS O-acetylase OafA/YrhL